MDDASRKAGLEKSEMALILERLLPLATEKLCTALDGAEAATADDRRRRRQAEALFGEADGQITAVQGALGSAVSELHRFLYSADAPLEITVDYLASELIRVAYNRWQRRRRFDERLRKEAERGGAVVNDRAETALAHAVQAAPEFAAQIQEFIDEIVERLPVRSRAVLKLRLAGQSQAAVAHVLKCHRSTVSRIEAQLRDLVRELILKSDVESAGGNDVST